MHGSLELSSGFFHAEHADHDEYRILYQTHLVDIRYRRKYIISRELESALSDIVLTNRSFRQPVFTNNSKQCYRRHICVAASADEFQQSEGKYLFYSG